MVEKENVRVIHIGQDTVRVHGEPNMARIRAATEKFMKEVEKQRYEQRKKTDSKTAASA